MKWLNIRIRGGAIWPTKETTVTFGGHKLVLKPATKDTDQSIHINLQGITSVEAITLINRFLSVLSWCDDQSIENRDGFSGTLSPVAMSKENRLTGSGIAFPFGRDLEENPKARLALALFREGRTVDSIPFEFLSYFKILNIFWNDGHIIEGIKQSLPHIRDERANQRIKELRDSQPDVPKYLYESGRCAIAHAYSNPIVDPDDTSDLRRLSQDVWIIKAIAEYLIDSELHVSRSIIG